MWATVLRVRDMEVNKIDQTPWSCEAYIFYFLENLANGDSLLTAIIIYYTSTLLPHHISL